MSMQTLRRRKLAGTGVAAALVAMIGLGGVVGSASAESVQRNIPLGGAQTARVEVKIDAGELKLHGGAAATDLLSGNFNYEAGNGEPEFDYSVEDGYGELEVEPDGGIDVTWPWDMVDDLGDTDWDVAINDTVTTDLKVDVDAGTLELALGGSAVSNLEVDIDAAKAEVDLSGVWTHDLTAELKADAGQLVVTIPTDVGVRIETDVDAGDKEIDGLQEVEDNVYVNDAYATATVKLTITADVDAGQLKIQVAE